MIRSGKRYEQDLTKAINHEQNIYLYKIDSSCKPKDETSTSNVL